jgi:hypothetical protein
VRRATDYFDEGIECTRSTFRLRAIRTVYTRTCSSDSIGRDNDKIRNSESREQINRGVASKSLGQDTSLQYVVQLFSYAVNPYEVWRG